LSGSRPAAGNDINELYAPRTSLQQYSKFWILSNGFLAQAQPPATLACSSSLPRLRSQEERMFVYTLGLRKASPYHISEWIIIIRLRAMQTVCICRPSFWVIRFIVAHYYQRTCGLLSDDGKMIGSMDPDVKSFPSA